MILLPPIPNDVRVNSLEHEVRRRAKITWLMRMPRGNRNDWDDHIEYIVEARAHIGHSFSKHKLGQWFVMHTENCHIESTHSHHSKFVKLLQIEN